MNDKVLYVPHVFRHPYFHGLLKAGREQRGWRSAVFCPEKSRPAYDEAIGEDGKFFFLPDFDARAPWESDPAKRQRIQKLIEECETLSGVSVNRILLSGERDLGRGYSKEFYCWPESGRARRCLSDPDYGQRIVERMFAFFQDAFETFKPDYVLAGATSAPLHLVPWLIANREGIPFLVNRRSKIHSKRCYWTRDFEMLNTLVREEYDRRNAANTRVSPEAKAYIERFRSEPDTVDYIKSHWRNTAAGEGWWSWHKQCALMALAQVNHVVKRRGGQPPPSAWRRLVHYYHTRYLALRQSRMVQTFTPAELGEMKYVYLPLHKEPELAINFQAFLWHSQKETVKQLSTMLPRGCRLLVREHRGTWGRRPMSFYRMLKRYPGVSVIDAFDPQFKYIRNADLVVTENGSSGWEGLLLNRPVITLHDNFYEPAGLATRCRDLTEFNREIVRQIRTPSEAGAKDYVRRLGHLIDAEWATTLPDDDDQHETSFGYIDRLRRQGAARNANGASRSKAQQTIKMNAG